MKAISLFSGAGGMDVGFRSAGFNIVWANDIDKDACKTYELNHGSHIVCGSVDDLQNEIVELSKKHHFSCLFGGPPCQGFSVAGKMDINDPRSQLVLSFMDVLEITRPTSFVMENVKALASLEKFRDMREALFKRAMLLGYNVELVVLNSKDYGVPQARERMFLVGIKDKTFNLLSSLKKYKKEPPTLREVLLSVGKIGSASNNRICKAKITLAANPVLRKSPYAGMLFNGQGRPLNLDGHSATLPASMGGNRTPIVDDEALYENQPEWIESYHASLLEGKQVAEYKESPKRLRRITVDEAIAIQTFPKDYKFFGSQSSVYKQIGNAVPCNLAHAVASAVKDILTDKVNPNAELKDRNLSLELV